MPFKAFRSKSRTQTNRHWENFKMSCKDSNWVCLKENITKTTGWLQACTGQEDELNLFHGIDSRFYILYCIFTHHYKYLQEILRFSNKAFYIRSRRLEILLKEDMKYGDHV